MLDVAMPMYEKSREDRQATERRSRGRHDVPKSVRHPSWSAAARSSQAERANTPDLALDLVLNVMKNGQRKSPETDQ